MKKSLLHISLVLLCAILLNACHSAGTSVMQVSSELQYLSITVCTDYQQVDILDPWQSGALLGRYYLVHDDAVSTPEDGLRIHVPVARLATTSATQIGFLHALNATSCVTAMATPHLVYNQPQQSIIDLGEDFNLNMEQLMLASPDLLLLTHYGAPMTNTHRIREAGIPVMELVEWMEQDPLARAAWIRLYGALTCRTAMADSILAGVVDGYTHCRPLRDPLETPYRQSIATGQSYRGTWYVPTAATYMGRLIMDAGADYAFAADTTHGSLPLTLEQALTTFADADVWIGVNARSLNELRQMDEKHTWMRAYQTGRVFNFDRRTTPAGGNDFWETGIVHPEYILQDIRWAIDSVQMNGYVPHYILPLSKE